MLVVRRDQLAAFAADRAARFQRSLVVHVHRSFPDKCASLGPTETERWVAVALERGRGHGFESERDLCKYVNLAFSFGLDFDRSSGCAWAVELLGSTATFATRMDALYQAGIEHAGLAEDGADV